MICEFAFTFSEVCGRKITHSGTSGGFAVLFRGNMRAVLPGLNNEDI
jgi:hypothetical protein